MKFTLASQEETQATLIKKSGLHGVNKKAIVADCLRKSDIVVYKCSDEKDEKSSFVIFNLMVPKLSEKFFPCVRYEQKTNAELPQLTISLVDVDEDSAICKYFIDQLTKGNHKFIFSETDTSLDFTISSENLPFQDLLPKTKTPENNSTTAGCVSSAELQSDSSRETYLGGYFI